MKTYLADIIPKNQRFSKQLDSLTLLTNQHWVVIDGIWELLISTNGRVETGKRELFSTITVFDGRID
jgi:hypothetical protein